MLWETFKYKNIVSWWRGNFLFKHPLWPRLTTGWIFSIPWKLIAKVISLLFICQEHLSGLDLHIELYYIWYIQNIRDISVIIVNDNLYVIRNQNRARWLRGNARDSHSGGPGFKSRCRPTWLRFFRGFPQSSRQMLGWIFITTIHLTILHQIHIS